MKTPALLVACLALAAGCKKDEPNKNAPPPPPPPQASNRPSQQPQPTMPPLTLPDDPLRAQKVELGHALFFDKRLSSDGSRACVSCHLNEDGNGGHNPLALGVGDKPLKRHAPVLWNVGYFQGNLAWDGRLDSLEAQVKAAWASPSFNVPEKDQAKKIAALTKIAGYKTMFEAAFPKQAVTANLIASAIAEYERTLICNETAYDKFAGGDKAALDESQQRGLDVFLGKGKCSACHTPPFFTGAMNAKTAPFYNAGVGTAGKAEADVDEGRRLVTKNEADWAAFKVPSLRNVTLSPPYFHDGSAATLDDALKVMAGGGIENKNLMRALLTDKKLTAEETSDLKAFLGALACPNKLEEPKLP